MASFRILAWVYSLSLILVLSSGNPSPVPTPSPSLLFVGELCRHGDRTPLFEFPSDSLPASKWPEGIGKLTAVGQRAQYELGQRIRTELVGSGFLSESYSPKEIYVRSSGIDRAYSSAYSQMAGLYPPGTASNKDVRVRYGKDALHDDEGGLPHRFQSIPIHSDSFTKETMLLPGANCPRHNHIIERQRSSDKFNKKEKSVKDALRAMAKAAGVDDVDSFGLYDAAMVSDAWSCSSAHSVPLPTAASRDLQEFGRNITSWLFTFENEKHEVRRLRAGLILNSMRRYMSLAAKRWRGTLLQDERDHSRKFVLFSAHDSTVAAALAAMGVFNGVQPPYNSTVIWRLLGYADGKLAVKLEYNGNPLILPGCVGENCNADDYVRSTKDMTVHGEDERHVECQTGWRRFAASVGKLLVGKKRSSRDEFDMEPGRAAPAFSLGIVLLISMTVAMVVLIVCVIFRWAVRYKGYSSAPVIDVDEQERNFMSQDPDLNRQILL